MYYDKLIRLLIMTVLFTVVISLLIAYQHGLYSLSVQMQLNIQKKIESQILTITLNLLSYLLIQAYVEVITLFIFILTYKRNEVINFYLNYAFARFIFLIAQTLLAGPRPFWEKNDLKSLDWRCPTGFGSLSEHIFFFIIFIEFIYDFKIKKIKSQTMKMLFLIFVCILIICQSFSSIYFGSHSIPQIFLSITCGLYYSLLFRLYGQNFIQNSLNYLQKKTKKEKIIFINILIVPIIISIPLFIFLFQQKNELLNSQIDIYRNTIEIKCNQVGQFNFPQSFYWKNFINNGLQALFPGLIMGIALSKYPQFNKGNYRPNPDTKALKILIFVIQASIISIIFMSSIMTRKFVKNIFVVYSIWFIDYYFIGIIMTCLNPLMLLKFNLIILKKDDSQIGEYSKIRVNQEKININ